MASQVQAAALKVAKARGQALTIALEELRKVCAEAESERDVAAIAQAKDEYATDELEIDDDAITSESGDNNGCWVAAWVYVQRE